MEFFNLRPVRCPSCGRVILKGEAFDRLKLPDKNGKVLDNYKIFELLGYRDRPKCCKLALSNPSQQPILSTTDNIIERKKEKKTGRNKSLESRMAEMDLDDSDDEYVLDEFGEPVQEYVGQFNNKIYSVPILKRIFKAV